MVSPHDSSDADSGESALHGTRLEAEHAGRRFVIQHDSAVGYYLYVFEDGRCTHDHLQGSLALAKECACEEFGVLEDTWREASSNI